MKRFVVVFFLFCASIVNSSAQYDKDVFYFRGRNALADGKYATAIENFNVLCELDPNDYWTFFYRGIAKYNLGDLRGAQQDFDTSVGINPIFTNGYHYRAITESRFGKHEEALADLQRAIDLRPGNDGLYFTRGVTYFLAQQFDSAVEDFNRYIKRIPDDPAAYLNRGATKLYLQDTVNALEDYNRAILLDRFDPEGYIRRGRLYAEKKEYSLAIDDLNHAVDLDPDNTYAIFNRAILHFDLHELNEAMADFNKVLEDEPGNALTLYNRSLINAEVGNYREALDDIDRVININPNNVLAYFNRASFFIEMERYQDALDDYDKTIELYPDFAKAYLNRSAVKSRLGQSKGAKQDYETAQKKLREYNGANADGFGSFADTTRKYNSLISFDADFAKKDFDNELLQHRDIDIRLRPLYKFNLTPEKENLSVALSHRFENVLIDKFVDESPASISISNTVLSSITPVEPEYADDDLLQIPSALEFINGLISLHQKQFSSAVNSFTKSIELAENESNNRYSAYYKSIYLMNRAALRAEMIDFMASIQNNVQTLTMDDTGTTRARLSDQVSRDYDYTEAIDDLIEAAEIAPDNPYLFFNLGNLYCLSSQMVNSISNYDKAISLYPYMGDAYFNRGLVLIYLKDKEKGCIDLSRAGELGVADSYSVISKYCEEENTL